VVAVGARHQTTLGGWSEYAVFSVQYLELSKGPFRQGGAGIFLDEDPECLGVVLGKSTPSHDVLAGDNAGCILWLRQGL